MSLKASCHCGATQIALSFQPTAAKSCNCTYCDRAGAIWAYFKPGEVVVQAEAEATYAPSGMNKHHFCSKCGMQTWGESPNWASVYNVDGTPKPGFEAGSMPTETILGVNLRLVEDLDWSKVEVEKVDGRNNW